MGGVNYLELYDLGSVSLATIEKADGGEEPTVSPTVMAGPRQHGKPAEHAELTHALVIEGAARPANASPTLSLAQVRANQSPAEAEWEVGVILEGLTGWGRGQESLRFTAHL
ncbi:hypothetical protein SKAU_G00344330 [Synaphobranchus kaupii]|uniref:Uncharacterized protein n=1 Tax=Synaphobranchus kaupii TaxID=118154 RepID=A0A9Q1EJ95_SYNKA|nr:hypothetical protein SKAU_G00344330 [Synaphobranchus kaupii]